MVVLDPIAPRTEIDLLAGGVAVAIALATLRTAAASEMRSNHVGRDKGLVMKQAISIQARKRNPPDT
jgi:hypothetical protein